MTGRPSSRRSSQSSPSDNDTPAPKTPKPFFGVHTYPQERQIQKIAAKIRKPLGLKDQLAGFVYVAKQTDDEFCKVGFSEKNAARRITDIGKCQILTDSSYQIGSFAGAHRAERLVHCLLSDRRHLRKWCTCGCVNWEWYKLDYQEVIRQVLIVYSWLRQNPYDLNAGEGRLTPVWEGALKIWEDTQNSKTPLGWNDFFIAGPSMDVVSDGLWHDSSPQPLLSRQMRDMIDLMQRPQVTKMFQNLIDLVQRPRMKRLQNGFKRAKKHLTHRVPGDASVSPASRIRLPHSDELSSPAISGDLEAADKELDPTPTKPPQSRPLRTVNRSLTARDAQAADNALSAPAVHSQQNAIIDLVNKSPSYSPQNSPVSALHAATVDQCQQSLLVPTIQQDANDSTLHANNRIGGAAYHHQTTVSLGDVGTPSNEKGSPRQSERFCWQGNRDIIANTEMCPPVRGAFPEDEIKESSTTELDGNVASELSDSLEELAISQNAQKEDYPREDAAGEMGALPINIDLVIFNSDDMIPVSHQLVSEAASSGSEQVACILDVESSSTNNDALSTQRKDQSRNAGLLTTDGSISGNTTLSTLDDQCVSQHAAYVALSESDMSRDTGTSLLHSSPRGEAAAQVELTEADKPSAATGSVTPQTDQDPCTNKDTDTTGSFVPANSSPLGGLASNDKPLEHQVQPSEGLPVEPFAPDSETEWSLSELSLKSDPSCHLVVADNSKFKESSWWETQSLPAMHFAPTSNKEVSMKGNAGCHSVVEDDAKSDNDSSGWETQSSLSDDIRPWRKQNQLVKELWWLYAEDVEYECTFDDNSGRERLGRLKHDLNAIEPLVTEKTQLSTRTDWPNEPSEDDSADESWATEDDAHASETSDEDGTDAQERKASKAREHELPRAQHPPGTASTTHPDVAVPALTARELLCEPVEDLRGVIDFQFNPAALNLDAPEFDPTQSTSHATTLSPTMEALTRIFGGLDIDPASKAVEPISEDVPTINPVPQKDSGSGHMSNEGEDEPAQPEDQWGRLCVPIERVKRADGINIPDGQVAEPNNGSNRTQQNRLPLDNKKTADKRPMLAIANEAHQWPAEDPVTGLSETCGHIQSPACVWGTGVKVRPWRKTREPFREEDFLYQKWSF